MSEEKMLQMEVSAVERKVLEMAREIDYGQIIVTIKHGAPILVEEVRKSIDLK